MQVSEESEVMNRRTEMAYKAQFPGKPAFMLERVQHDKAPGSGDRVNTAGCVVKDHALIR